LRIPLLAECSISNRREEVKNNDAKVNWQCRIISKLAMHVRPRSEDNSSKSKRQMDKCRSKLLRVYSFLRKSTSSQILLFILSSINSRKPNIRLSELSLYHHHQLRRGKPPLLLSQPSPYSDPRSSPALLDSQLGLARMATSS
jgi:hypothetical protein